MKRLDRGKAPMWKKTILENLSLEDVCRNLEKIADSGDYYGYEGESMGEYYEEYRELFNELSMGASDLIDVLAKIEESDGDAFAGWDDCTVSLLGQVEKVYGYDAAEMDYFALMDPWEENVGVREAEKRLTRLTKTQMVHLFRQVMAALTAYMDIKGSYDTLNAVVTELDERAAAMQNGSCSSRMWAE